MTVVLYSIGLRDRGKYFFYLEGKKLTFCIYHVYIFHSIPLDSKINLCKDRIYMQILYSLYQGFRNIWSGILHFPQIQTPIIRLRSIKDYI